MSWFRFKKKEIDQVKSGFRIVGQILLAFMTFTLFLGGFSVVRFPKGMNESSWMYQNAAYWGFFFILIASIILVLTVDKWSKAIPGIFALGVFNGVGMIFSGHLINQPSKLISRPEAIAVALLSLSISLLSAKMFHRELTVIDRFCFMGFYFGMAWSVTSSEKIGEWVGMGIAILALVLAVIIHGYRLHTRRTHAHLADSLK